MEKLLRRIAALFPDDPSCPGIVMAYLPDKDRFYISAVRYAEARGQGKYVVTSAQGPDIGGLVEWLSEELERVEAIRGEECVGTVPEDVHGHVGAEREQGSERSSVSDPDRDERGATVP